MLKVNLFFLTCINFKSKNNQANFLFTIKSYRSVKNDCAYGYSSFNLICVSANAEELLASSIGI